MAIPTAQIDSVAVQALDEAEAAAALEAQAKAEARSATPDESPDSPRRTAPSSQSLYSNDEALDARLTLKSPRRGNPFEADHNELCATSGFLDRGLAGAMSSASAIRGTLSRARSSLPSTPRSTACK